MTSSMSSTANMMRRMPSVFAGALCGSALTAAGVWNFVSSTRPWPSGVRIIAMSARTPSSRRAVNPLSLDWRLALQLHAEFDEERHGRLQVVDHDADVVHPLRKEEIQNEPTNLVMTSGPPGSSIDGRGGAAHAMFRTGWRR